MVPLHCKHLANGARGTHIVSCLIGALSATGRQSGESEGSGGHSDEYSATVRDMGSGSDDSQPSSPPHLPGLSQNLPLLKLSHCSHNCVCGTRGCVLSTPLLFAAGFFFIVLSFVVCNTIASSLSVCKIIEFTPSPAALEDPDESEVNTVTTNLLTAHNSVTCTQVSVYTTWLSRLQECYLYIKRISGSAECLICTLV